MRAEFGEFSFSQDFETPNKVKSSWEKILKEIKEELDWSRDLWRRIASDISSCYEALRQAEVNRKEANGYSELRAEIEDSIASYQAVYKDEAELVKNKLRDYLNYRNKLISILREEMTIRRGWLDEYPYASKAIRGQIDECKRIENYLLKTGDELAIKIAGFEGEQKVDYALKWLQPKGYKAVTKDCLNKHGDICLVLKNRGYMNESQEIDHVVVGKNGVFMIETKNYSGKISVTKSGNWIQEKDREQRTIKSPIQQCDRHKAVLQSIVKDVPITSVICIANDTAIVENQELSPVPIVTDTILQRFIESTRTKVSLSEQEITEIIHQIDLHKVIVSD